MAQNKKPNIVKKAPQPEIKKTEVRAADPVRNTQSRTRTAVKANEFLFGKKNFIVMLVGLVFIIVGFILMIGGGSEDPKVFNPEIFSARRLTVAPILILLGYAIEVYAIMLKPSKKAEA